MVPVPNREVGTDDRVEVNNDDDARVEEARRQHKRWEKAEIKRRRQWRRQWRQQQDGTDGEYNS